MSRGISKRYHVSVGKSVKSLKGAGVKRLAVFLHYKMTRLAHMRSADRARQCLPGPPADIGHDFK
jgi:hypothetical protein